MSSTGGVCQVSRGAVLPGKAPVGRSRAVVDGPSAGGSRGTTKYHGPVFSVLMVLSAPDERRSTENLALIVREMASRPDVSVHVWYLRVYPEHRAWPRSRNLDSLRTWWPARLLERLVSARLADVLRGLRLRWWFLQVRPDVVLLDDGLGERILTPRMQRNRPRPVVVSRANPMPPLGTALEPDPITRPDLALVLPRTEVDAVTQVRTMPSTYVVDYPPTPLQYSAARARHIRRTLDVPPDLPLVVGWGHDAWLDGPDLFVRALWALEHRYGVVARGLWLGLDEAPDIERLRAEAVMCGVSDRFHVRAEDTEAARFCGDAAFLPFRDGNDSLDLTILLLAGLGVVTFDTDGARDPMVVEVPPLDVDAAAAALAPMLTGDRDAVAQRIRRRRLDVLSFWVDEFLRQTREIRDHG